MNTNPGNSVNRNIPNSISSFFSSATSSITDGKALNYSIHTGGFGVPYATMALVTIIAGTFTYVTYTDYTNDPGDDIESDEEDEGEDEDEDKGEDEGEGEDDDNNLGMFNPLNDNSVNSNPEDAEKKEQEDAEKKEQEDAEKKAEEPGKQYTLGGKPRSCKIKPTKRKYTKRKTRG